MKAGDFKPCALCGRGVMHAGIPLFYRGRSESMGIDANAVRQTAGLEMMFGNVALARVMGPDPDIAKPLGDEVIALVCQPCALQPNLIAQLAGAA